MTATEHVAAQPSSAANYHLHEHLTASLHQLLDTLDQHPELAAVHVCTSSDGSIRVCVQSYGAPLADRIHAVDVLAESFHLPHAETSPVAYAAQQNGSAVWTVTRTESAA